jgi:hypothetical protein
MSLSVIADAVVYDGSGYPGRGDAATLRALMAVSLAFQRANNDRANNDAGVPIFEGSPLLWVATEEGSRAVDEAFWRTAAGDGGAYASPMLFASTLPSAVAAEVTRVFRMRGPVVVVAGAGSAPSRPPAGLAALLGAQHVLALVLHPDHAHATIYTGEPLA